MADDTLLSPPASGDGAPKDGDTTLSADAAREARRAALMAEKARRREARATGVESASQASTGSAASEAPASPSANAAPAEKVATPAAPPPGSEARSGALTATEAVAAQIKDASRYRIIGKSMPKVDGMPKINGQARFTDDMKLPRMLIGKTLRSPHAHARITHIDTSRAEALPGVLCVITGKDIPTKYGIIPVAQDETALAIDKVRYVGEPVACVAALDEETAYNALKLIDVTYETLPTVMTIDEALEGKIILHEQNKTGNILKNVQQTFGEVDALLGESEVIVEDDYYYEGCTHVPLESHSALASWDHEGRLELWSSTQVPHYLQRELSKVLGVPQSRVRVVKPHFGSGYGGKSEPFSLEFCACVMAKKTGRPVKITYTREEVFYAHRGRHAAKMWLKLGAKKDGTLTALDFKCWLDGGGYASFGVVTTYYTGVFHSLPYNLPAFRWETSRLYTNKPPCGPKRGHGAIQPRFAFEIALDQLAEKLGMDPAELRRKNFIEPGHKTVNDFQVTSCGMKEAMEKVLAESGYFEKKGKLPRGRGIGVACSAYICGAGQPIYANDMPHSTVNVKLDRSGCATIFSGSADIGQGSNIMLAMVVAEILGIEVADCKVIEADTDLTPVDLGSYSSRVTFMVGNAARNAAEQLRAKLLQGTADHLRVPVEEVEQVGNEMRYRKDPTRRITLQRAIHEAEARYGGLTAAGIYKPPRLSTRLGGRGAGPSPAYTFTAQVAEVSVDEETGMVTVEKVWCAHDCGRALNPVVVEGQIEGSVYMGFGEAIFEAQRYYRNGLMTTPSILEYKLPTIYDTPEIKAYYVETVDPNGPFGAKEAGEGPQLPTAPVVANAIFDAIGVRFKSNPMTPDVVLKALEGRTTRKNMRMA